MTTLAQDTAVESATAHTATPTGAEDQPSLFAGTIYQTAATLIVLFVLYVILKKYAWAPILKGLADRENKIKEADAEAAEKANKEAAAILEDYKKKLAPGPDRRRPHRRRSPQGSRKTSPPSIQVTNAKTEIDQSKARALSDIKFAKEQAVAELYAPDGPPSRPTSPPRSSSLAEVNAGRPRPSLSPTPWQRKSSPAA